MNNIIPLSTLADLLAHHAEIPVERATAFIRAYFDTLEKSLSTDKTLTVNGLGTFEIKTDDSISFTPAPEFASRVNDAYEVFPAIDIDSDFDIDTFAEKPVKEPEQEDKIRLSEAEPEPEPESQPEVIIAEQAVEIDEETEKEIETPTEPGEEPVTMEEDPVSGEEVAEDEDEDEPEEELLEYDPEEKRCCTALYIILTALIALIVGIVIGYLGRHRIDAFVNSSGEADKAATQTDSVAADKAIDSNIQIIEVDTSAVNLTDIDIAEINDPSTDIENDDPTAEPSVRYDTVTSKRFLTTMAREYFGHQDYWSYIYLANKAILKHPDRIRPGTRVVIPDFETYKTSDDPEQNRIDAHRKGLEIYQRFN